MFNKYNRINASKKPLFLYEEVYSKTEFLRKFKYSNLLPNKSNFDLSDNDFGDKIFVVSAIFDQNISLDFFLFLIQNVQNDNVCFVHNEYHFYDEINLYLTKKYNGEMIIRKTDSKECFLKLDKTLIDNGAIFDWYNIWGHGFTGWIISQDQSELFKKIVDGVHSLETETFFLKTSFIKIEFGDIHESIRFITLNEELSHNIALRIMLMYNDFKS